MDNLLNMHCILGVDGASRLLNVVISHHVDEIFLLPGHLNWFLEELLIDGLDGGVQGFDFLVRK